MSSDFPLSVRSRNIVFLSQQGRRGCVFAVFFTPIPEKGISDFIAHGSIIRVFTVHSRCVILLLYSSTSTTAIIKELVGSKLSYHKHNSSFYLLWHVETYAEEKKGNRRENIVFFFGFSYEHITFEVLALYSST